MPHGTLWWLPGATTAFALRCFRRRKRGCIPRITIGVASRVSVKGAMFPARKQRTVIAEGMKIVGYVSSEGPVEVYGEVEGEMRCATLVIARTAHIVGAIKAENITVDGTIEGAIECGDATFYSQANVVGDVRCRTLIVEQGAFMDGNLHRLPGGQRDGSRLLTKGLTTAFDRQRETERIIAGESSTHIVELVVEARYLSGNPDLPQDEALPFWPPRS